MNARLFWIACVTVLILHGTAMGLSFRFVPVRDIAKETDCFVQGVVEEVTVDKKRPPAGQPDRPEPAYSDQLNLSVRFRVVESYPRVDEKVITISGWGRLRDVPVDKRFLMALKKGDGVYGPVYSFSVLGNYELHEAEPLATVYGLVRVPHIVTIDDAWRLIRATYDQSHGTGRLDANEVERVLAALRGGTLSEAALALELLPADSPEELTQGILLDALDRLYKEIMVPGQSANSPLRFAHSKDSEEVFYFRVFTLKAFERLIPLANEQGVSRALAFYVAGWSNLPDSVFRNSYDNEIPKAAVRLAAKHSGPTRRERILSLFGKNTDLTDGGYRLGKTPLISVDSHSVTALSKIPGEDIDRILLEIFDNPDKFGLPSTHMLGLWGALASRGHEEIRPYLVGLVSGPAQKGYRNCYDQEAPWNMVVHEAQGALDALDKAKAASKAKPAD